MVLPLPFGPATISIIGDFRKLFLRARYKILVYALTPKVTPTKDSSPIAYAPAPRLEDLTFSRRSHILVKPWAPLVRPLWRSPYQFTANSKHFLLGYGLRRVASESEIQLHDPVFRRRIDPNDYKQFTIRIFQGAGVLGLDSVLNFLGAEISIQL